MPNTSEKETRASPEAEIRELERKLAEKKQELAERGETIPHEKEVFREVLRKHIEEAKSAPAEEIKALSGRPQGIPGIGHQTTSSLKQEERDEKLRKLTETALKSTISKAVRIALSQSPYLLDELHDHLVDDYYDKLIAMRKLKKL